MQSFVLKPSGSSLGVKTKVLILDEGNEPVAVEYTDLRNAVKTDLNGTAQTFTELQAFDGNTMATAAGAGITGGTGTVCVAGVDQVGSMIRTTIIVDLTGLNSKNTDGDIIGVDGTSDVCHIGQITAAVSGTIIAGTMTCHELPAGGDPNIDLYAADEGTGVEDGAIGDLTETQLIDAAGDWAAGDVKNLTAWPAADQYLYLTQGDATGTDATYTAGRFVIELWGY